MNFGVAKVFHFLNNNNNNIHTITFFTLKRKKTRDNELKL